MDIADFHVPVIRSLCMMESFLKVQLVHMI